MDTPKFTPGPWWNESGVIHAKDKHWTPESHSCCHPASVQDVDSWDESEANAQLISAAPDMYTLLKRIEFSGRSFDGREYNACCPICHTPIWVKTHKPDCQLEATLKKAEGR
jgi:hypothetical protein